ncbi:hypothetical protein TNCT_690761, partial [Trichonephila clavata]
SRALLRSWQSPEESQTNHDDLVSALFWMAYIQIALVAPPAIGQPNRSGATGSNKQTSVPALPGWARNMEA